MGKGWGGGFVLAAEGNVGILLGSLTLPAHKNKVMAGQLGRGKEGGGPGGTAKGIERILLLTRQVLPTPRLDIAKGGVRLGRKGEWRRGKGGKGNQRGEVAGCAADD